MTVTEEIEAKRLAFIQSINKDREDDALRLIYADWLESEAADHIPDAVERAELIRVQIEKHTLETKWTGHEYRRPRDAALRLGELTFRSRQLQKPFSSAIAQDFNLFTDWRRGLVYRTIGLFENWRKHSRKLLKEHPVETVKFLWSRDLPELENSAVKAAFRIRWPNIEFTT